MLMNAVAEMQIPRWPPPCGDGASDKGRQGAASEGVSKDAQPRDQAHYLQLGSAIFKEPAVHC